MQIKVKDTRMHNLPTYEVYKKVVGIDSKLTGHQQILVAEAKLVLIEQKIFESKYAEKYITFEKGKVFLPILISETEKIEAGDWFYNIKSGFIAELHESQNTVEGDYKVLALPEHFSPKHLQAIVDGKMKDGDKVLVECDKNTHDDTWSINHIDHSIKLNSSNHITLYKKEEKMYTRAELQPLFNMLNSMRSANVQFNFVIDSWFEQNVK